MADEIKFRGEEPKSGLVEDYVPYKPPMVKMISASTDKPPLLPQPDRQETYAIENMPFEFRAHLLFEDAQEGWKTQTPLALCRYLRPTEETKFDVNACSEIAIENAKRERHNRFIIDTLRAFMRRFDCGTSAGLITMPSPPEDPIEARLIAIKRLTTDKLNTTKKAIEYCARYGLYCGKDFEFDKAFEKANDVCFDETIKSRVGDGKRVRVRLEGRHPTWWDGISETDSSGKRVEWKRGVGHTFLTPNVCVVESLPPSDKLALVPVQSAVTAENKGPNAFDELFNVKP